MRIDQNKLILSKAEADLYNKTPPAILTAFGCLAVSAAIFEAEAQAKVNLIIEFFRSQGRTPDEVELALAQELQGEDYIEIMSNGETRYILEQVFRYHSVDDVHETSPEFMLRQSDIRIAEAAIEVLA